jgi:hypothetical protein
MTSRKERESTFSYSCRSDPPEENRRDGEIYYPAGYPIVVAVDAPGEDVRVGVSCWQLEIARHGLPDLYAAKIVMLDQSSQERQDISDAFPTSSPEAAISRLKGALEADHATAMAMVLGDSNRTRIFGVAASPDCMANALRKPAPTQTELHRLQQELGSAVKGLSDVFARWEGTGALSYLERHLRLFRHERQRVQLADTASWLEQISWTGGADVPKRKGRPLNGGTPNVVARALAGLWANCGLGVPKLSPQSRFIRACTMALPWHGIHKADVAQFMRAELAKKRRGEVLIG